MRSDAHVEVLVREGLRESWFDHVKEAFGGDLGSLGGNVTFFDATTESNLSVIRIVSHTHKKK